MKKSTILEISKLPNCHVASSKDVDIDTLIHDALYNLSQSSFDRQLPFNDRASRYFIDIAFPVAILKVCSELASFPEWKQLKQAMPIYEKTISEQYQILRKFSNHNLNENPFYTRNKEPLNDEIEAFCDKFEDIYFAVNKRQLAHHAVMNRHQFRKEFYVQHQFPEPRGTFNFKKILKQETLERLQWKEDQFEALKQDLSSNMLNQTFLRSFADFTKKVSFEPDAPVYGTNFILDYMPEILSRIASHNEQDWGNEIEKLRNLSFSQKKMIAESNKLISKIIRVENTWNRDNSRVLQDIARLKENKNEQSLGLEL